MAQVVNFNDIKMNDIISFTTYGNSIIPNVVDATVLAIESGTGLRNPTVAAVNAANMYPSLPVTPGITISTTYTSYTYLLLKLQDGSQIEVADIWINPVSLTRKVRTTGIFAIHDFDPSESASVISKLNSLGYVNITFTTSV